jgi:hypothetical protein
MSDDDLLTYMSQQHSGKTISQFRKGDGAAYKQAWRRGLIDTLVERNILESNGRRPGFFSKMSDDELTGFIRENYQGSSVSDFSRGKDSQAYDVARQRGLIDSLVARRVLVRQQRKHGFFSKMEDQELTDYIATRYRGKSVSELIEAETSAYQTAWKQGLVQRLIDEGVLTEKRKPKNFFRGMDDEELMRYIGEIHGGEALSTFKKKSPGAHRAARERKLLDSLVSEGILTKQQKDLPWRNSGDWKKHGLERGYNKRSPTSLQQSEDDAERAWYSKGARENWIDDFEFSRMRNRKITDGHFLRFLGKDDVAKNLAAAALLLNGEAVDVEQIMVSLFHGKFENQGHLHELLQGNRDEIYNLLGEGITNLGAYIGEFSLDDRSIIPVLLGEAIMKIPADKLTAPLEDKLFRVQRAQYGPRFNDNPKETLEELSGRANESEGRVRNVYQRLHDHYTETLALQEELN